MAGKDYNPYRASNGRFTTGKSTIDFDFDRKEQQIYKNRVEADGLNEKENNPEEKSIQEYKQFYQKGEILKADVTVYRGGRERPFTSDHAVFTATSKDSANQYAYRGSLQTYKIEKGSKFLIVDMKGENWSKTFKKLDGLGDSKLTREEKQLLGRYTRDPLRGIAEVARSRGYDGALIKNVVDPKGVTNSKSGGLYLDPIDEYVVTNITKLQRLN